MKYFNLPAINPEKIIHAVLMIAWVFFLFSSSGLRKLLIDRIYKTKLVVALMALYLTWRLISGLVSDESTYYFQLKTLGFEVFNYFSLYFIALSAWGSFEDARKFIIAIVITTTAVLAITVVESQTQHIYFAKYANVQEDATGRLAETIREKYRAGKYRVQANMEHPLVLAEYLMLAAPLFLYIALRQRKAFIKLLTGTAIMVLFFAIYKTDSRAALSALMMLVVLSPIIFLYSKYARKRGELFSITLVIFLAFLVLTVPLALESVFRIISGDLMAGSASTESRIYMIDKGIPLIDASPLFGYGIGVGGAKVGYILVSGLYSIDNYYLTIALDSGLPALLLLIAIKLYFLFKAGRLLLNHNAYDMYALSAIIVSLVGFFVMRSILTIPTNYWLVYILFAMIVLLDKNQGPHHAGQHGKI